MRDAVRRVRRSIAGQPATRAARRVAAASAILRPRTGFIAGELRGGVRRYRLASGRSVVIRHRSRDLDVVVEVLGRRSPYEPPAALAPRLDRPLRILDLGGNIGLFGAFALGRFDVVALRSFEPDPANAAVLQRTIALNDGAGWEMEAVAVSNAAGELRFLSAGSPDSRLAGLDERAVAVPAVDLFGLDGDVDLLKIDIEGGEWALLGDPRLATLQAPVIVLEWHWRFAPGPDPHAAARAGLRAAGYQIVADEPEPATGIGLIWAARP
jgi:FkbM family methyltransferase